MSKSLTSTALAEVTLPDGRQILAPHAQQAQFLWQSVSLDPYYGAGADLLAPGDVVLDIGANIGLTSLRFVAAVPDLRVIAVEPAAASYQALAVNLTRHAQRATAVQAAVGSQCGTGELTYYPDSPANSTLHADFADTVRIGQTLLRNLGLPTAARSQRERAVVAKFQHARTTAVPITTVAALFTRYELDRVALLKIDVERAELAVLGGVGGANWPRIDRVVAEVHDVDDRLNEVARLLTAHGYDVRTEQEPIMAGTNLYMVVAKRS